MSEAVETIVIPPGDDSYVAEAWDLKESIRESADVLKQARSFFVNAYAQAEVRALRHVDNDELIGFAATRKGGYLLFLAISPDYQGQGYGRTLVSATADAHGSITCHARTTNSDALSFYESLGFDIVRRIDGYYEDGGDAYFLRLGDRQSITSRVSKYIGR